MDSSVQTGAVLAYSYALPRGPRVRLRLARGRDVPAIRGLLERQGHDPAELELARLVRFDPRTRFVICATALIESHESLVGVGAIELGEDATTKPDLVVVDEQQTQGLDDLIQGALASRAVAAAQMRTAAHPRAA